MGWNRTVIREKSVKISGQRDSVEKREVEVQSTSDSKL